MLPYLAIAHKARPRASKAYILPILRVSMLGSFCHSTTTEERVQVEVYNCLCTGSPLHSNSVTFCVPKAVCLFLVLSMAIGGKCRLPQLFLLEVTHTGWGLPTWGMDTLRVLRGVGAHILKHLALSTTSLIPSPSFWHFNSN